MDPHYQQWEEFSRRLTAAAQQPVGGSHPSFDSFTAADLTHHDLNESNSGVPLQHRDNYGYDHRQSYNHDHATDAYNVNLNIVNNPYNYNAGGSQQQPEWPVQTPVYQNPSNLPPNLPNPPLWPIHAQGHVGSSSHATSNPLSALEVPTHSFDFPLDSVHQKLNRGPRDFKSQHALYTAVASRRQSNSKRTGVVQPQSIPDSIRVIQMIILPPQLIEQVKAKAYTNMMRLTFENTFFPADDTLTDLANEVLDTAVAQYANGNYNFLSISPPHDSSTKNSGAP